MEYPELGSEKLEAPDFLKVSHFLVIGGILSGVSEGFFILESFLFPLLAVSVSYLVIRRESQDFSLIITLPVMLFLTSARISVSEMIFMIFPAAVAALTVYISPGWLRKVLMAVSVQLLDALTTVLVLESGGEEKVFVSAYFLEIAGYTGLFILKALVLLPFMIYSVRRKDADLLEFLVYSAGIILVFHNLAL